MKKKRLKTHDPYMEFKGWLRGNSLKYEDIAKLLGLTVSTVSDKINGFSDFRLSETEKIVSEYKVSYDIF